MSKRVPSHVNADSAESAFYQAFARCDLQAMAAVWADDGVSCIHPGSSALLGRDAVLRSWSHILTAAQVPEIRYRVLLRTATDNMAVHLVEEVISTADNIADTAVVIATNVYRRDEEAWLMLAHHATPSRRQYQQPTLQ